MIFTQRSVTVESNNRGSCEVDIDVDYTEVVESAISEERLSEVLDAVDEADLKDFCIKNFNWVKE